MVLVAIHPGEHLAIELRALKISAAELARLINVPRNRVTLILNGRRAITGDTALRLAHFFGTSAELWLALQSGPASGLFRPPPISGRHRASGINLPPIQIYESECRSRRTRLCVPPS